MNFLDGHLEFNRRTGNWTLSGGGGHDSWGCVYTGPELVEAIGKELKRVENLRKEVIRIEREYNKDQQLTEKRLAEWDAANPVKGEL